MEVICFQEFFFLFFFFLLCFGPASFKLGMVIDIIDLYSLIPAGIILILIHCHSCVGEEGPLCSLLCKFLNHFV